MERVYQVRNRYSRARPRVVTPVETASEALPQCAADASIGLRTEVARPERHALLPSEADIVSDIGQAR
jgi:hypothetical protein